MNSRTPRAALLFLVAAACSGSTTSTGTPGSDASSTSHDAGSGTLPIGTCSLTLSGARTGTLTGVGYGEMDGSGNLDVTCGGFPSASADKLLLNIGNGSYDGPATYDIDSTLAHGDVTLTVSTGTYSAFSLTAGCVVDLTTAPPGDDAPSGSSIAGTFSCTGLTTSQSGDSIDITGGAFTMTVR